MTQRVFWCETIAVGEQTLDEAESRHARTSLRLDPGDRVTLMDGAGRIGHAILLAGGVNRKRNASVHVRVERVELIDRPARRLTLIVAACKGERMDWLVEKCTELGVDRVCIGAFERSVATPGGNKLDRFIRLARQACKQSRRAWMPEFRANLTALEAVAAWQRESGGRLIFAHPENSTQNLAAVLRNGSATAVNVAVVVGPEGGLREREITALRRLNAVSVTISPNILRVETAAVAVASVWSDWNCEPTAP